MIKTHGEDLTASAFAIGMLPLGTQLPYKKEAKAARLEKPGAPANSQHQVPAFELTHPDLAANPYTLMVMSMFRILMITWLFFTKWKMCFLEIAF